MAEIGRESSEIQHNTDEVENRPEVADIIAWGEKALRGDFPGDISEFDEREASEEQTEYALGEFDMADTVILDLNSDRYTEDEKKQILEWIEHKLGDSIVDFPAREKYVHSSNLGGFKVFDKQFGTPDNQWFITEWQNIDEEPSYVIWSESMIAMQEEMEYSKE